MNRSALFLIIATILTIQTLVAQTGARGVLPGHPRLLLNNNIIDTWEPSKGRLQAVRDRVRGAAAADFATLRSTLDNSIKGNFTAYSDNGGMLAVAGYAFAYLMLKDSDPTAANRYASTVINNGLLKSSWHTGVQTDSEPLMAEAYALAYDWCYDWIVANGVRAAAIAKLKEAYAAHSDDGQTWQQSIRESDFHNYAAGFLSEFTALGLALHGDDPAAAGMLNRGWGMFAEGWRMSPAGYGENILYKLKDSIDVLTGGAMNWEGPMYWRSAVPEMLRGIEEYDTATGRSHSVWTTQFSNTVNAAWYKIYSVRPDGKHPGIGDGTDGTPPAGRDNFAMVILLDRFKTNAAAPYIKKWIPEVPGGAWDAGQGGQLGLLWKILFWDYPGVVNAASSYASLPLGREFGQDVVMRSGWGSGDTYITASFNWGGIYHRAIDVGTFTIFKGAALTSRPPYTTSMGDYYHQYFRRTISGNTLLVYDQSECIRDNTTTCGVNGSGSKLTNDGGQRWSVFRRYDPPFLTNKFGINHLWSGSTFADPTLAPLKYAEQMRMADKVFTTKPGYDYVNADVTKAYTNEWSGLGDNGSNRVTSAVRQMLYLRPNYLVVFDQVTSTNAGYAKSWVLHTLKAPQVNAASWVTPGPGINRYSAKQIRTDSGGGRLFVTAMLPQSAQVRVVGGNSCPAVNVVSATAATPAVFTTDVSHGLQEGEFAAFQNIAAHDPGGWGSDYGIATDNPGVGGLIVHPTGLRTFTLTNQSGKYIAGTGVSPAPNGRLFPDGVKLTYHSNCGWEGWVDNVGGSGRNLWYPLNRRADLAAVAPSWRIEIKPETPQAKDYFLNVLYPATTGVSTAPPATLIDVAGFYGVQIADPAMPQIALFNKNKAAASSVTYSASYAGKGNHTVTGLSAGVYNVFRDSASVASGVAVGADGTLSFSSQGGTFAVTQSSAAPPPVASASCDLNSDGAVNVADLQLAINQAIQIGVCTSADVNLDGKCDVADVQRLVTVALGGVCRVGI